ncbi:MAG: O-antigen ligase family protein [Bacteroidales bacterium]|nr:O-antigen ligase family protein [Bacteroidales bacterium]
MTNESAWSLFVRYTCYFGLALMLAALPLSRFFMSVAQFILAGVFICEGIDEREISTLSRQSSGKIRIPTALILSIKEGFMNLIKKLGQFFRNKPAWIFSSLLLIDFFGLLFTSDLAYGMKVLRNNLPLLLLPLFLSSFEKIPPRLFRLFLLIFATAVVAGSLNSTYLLIIQDITDTRQISPFIHHIRFSLMVCMAIFILAYYAFKKKASFGIVRAILILMLAWLIVYLFMLRSLSGIIAFFVTLVPVLILTGLRSTSRRIKFLLGALLVALPLIIGCWVYMTVKNYTDASPVEMERLDAYTPGGEMYVHDATMGVEDGKYIGLYLCWPELEENWNRRSRIAFDSLDHKGQEIRYTLIRYLNSKDLRKDSTGVAALTDQDVNYVEHGIANVHDLKKFSVRNRIHHMAMDYQTYRRTGAHTGSSAIERLEQGKAALYLIRGHWMTGVGTGDIRTSFHEAFRQMNSPLQSANEGMFSAHNQFLTVMASYGIPGLIWFLFAILYPALKKRSFSNYFFVTFFTIALVSFLGDDTLNNQAGVTFFAFFYSLFVLSKQDTDHETI